MYQRIMAPIDIDVPGSWERAITYAADVAKTHGAVLHVMSVVPTYGMSIVGSFFSVEKEREMIRKCKERLVGIVSGTVPEGITAKAHIAHGTVYEEILLAAGKLQIDLIIMMANRPEFNGYLIGPNAERVVRHARQSVLIVHS